MLLEAFLNMPSVPSMSPQTMLMESVWIGNWFVRLLNLAEDKNNDQVFIADRSPFSAVCYAGKHGKLLEPVIRAQMDEVLAAANIEIYSVHLEVDSEILWSRISSRLIQEPGRVAYDEDKREHMDKINEFYEGFEWDFTVDNSGEDGRKVVDDILKGVGELSEKFKVYNQLNSTCLKDLKSEQPKTSAVTPIPNKKLEDKFNDCVLIDEEKKEKEELYAIASPTTVVTAWLEA